MAMDSDQLRSYIRDIEDFPQAGVTFRDITPLLGDASAFDAAVEALASPFFGRVDVVAGVEARGFILAAPVARRLGAGFVPIRKPGKLPWETISQSYELEYGIDTLEVHVDAVGSGERVLLIDDVLATGGTAGAAVSLLEGTGASIVGVAFLLELEALGGRALLEGQPIHSVLGYP
jgi:adenine phosphoribosyltransferase